MNNLIFSTLCLIILSLSTFTFGETKSFHPLSQERIDEINQKAKTWKAGKNFEIGDWEKVKRMIDGVLPSKSPITIVLNNPHDEKIKDVPDSFDARDNWPNCDSLKQIWDQSGCGSCWAIAASAAMSDRICIHSNQSQQTYVSVEDILSCCLTCGFGCNGGFPDMAWYYWQETGVVTGGLYQSNQGCRDYTLQPCEHHVDNGDRPQCGTLNYDTPACVKKCSNYSSLDYDKSLTYGLEVASFTTEKQIQLEILENGPIEATFDVYDDFPLYKSGVYQRVSDSYLGGHAIKILGWGVENDVPYWLIANSWNTDWGDNGYVKFLRGENNCGIESEGVAALPKLE